MKEFGVVVFVAKGIGYCVFCIWGVLVRGKLFPVVFQMGFGSTVGVFHLIVLPLEWLISKGLVLLIGTLIR